MYGRLVRSPGNVDASAAKKTCFEFALDNKMIGSCMNDD